MKIDAYFSLKPLAALGVRPKFAGENRCAAALVLVQQFPMTQLENVDTGAWRNGTDAKLREKYQTLVGTTASHDSKSG